jgi:putative hydrolase of the HAD superfamily
MTYANEIARNISTVFLDSGKTLRVVSKDPVYQKEIRQKISELIGYDGSSGDLFNQLTERYHAYKQMAKGMMLQSSETELWTRWMLPDESAEKIAPLISQLTRLWHDRNGCHVARPDVKTTIQELHNRGYILGILANALSTQEIPEWLKADGLSEYFKAVVLSSNFGRRKPDVHIFLDSAYEVGVKPANCAYVGDDPTIDIKGARQAGFGMILILTEQAGGDQFPSDGVYKADGTIRKCSDLLNIFPPR